MGVTAHLREKEERKSKAFYNGKRVNSKKYQQIEGLISAISADIVNGVQRSDILTKLKEKMYDEQSQPYKESTAINYYWAATQRLKEDREEDMETLKDKLYSQYYQLYTDAMMVGNTFAAKSVLDSIAKVFINDNRKNVDVTVDNSNDKINISFGFDSE